MIASEAENKSGETMAVQVKSELSARVWKIEVPAGGTVAEGEPIMILESMKMEIPVLAPVGGRIGRLLVAETDTVSEGQLLATIEP
jgi:acetyl-CoA carboxylase biotin carboxyl carrier protein